MSKNVVGLTPPDSYRDSPKERGGASLEWFTRGVVEYRSVIARRNDVAISFYSNKYPEILRLCYIPPEMTHP
jgi:hypothetical protein